MLESMMRCSPPARRHSNGVTLVELLVGMAVLGVLLSLAAPSFTGYLINKRVEGVANELMTDLQFARSEAVSRNSLIRVRFGSATQYTIEAETPLPASVTCTPAGTRTTVKTVNLPPAITLQGSAGGALPACSALEPVRATAPLQAAVEVVGPDSRTLRVFNSPSGRVQICKPSGSIVGGYIAC